VADEVSVLIVDDSALMRNLIGHMIEDTPGSDERHIRPSKNSTRGAGHYLS